MKKLLVFAVAALALAACTQERSIVPADSGLTSLTASHVSTRSALESSEGETPTYNILWNAPDSILVGYAGTTPTVFTSKNESPAAEATFTGKLPEGSGTLYGIYPATSGNTVDSEGTFTIAFKGEQTAVAGSYDPEAFPSVAVSESTNLGFQNVCGLLAIKVGYDDVTRISLSDEVVEDLPPVLDGADHVVTTRYAAMTALPGGDLTVSIEEGEPAIVEFSEPLTCIVLNAPEGQEAFSQDATYYMAVPPCSFSHGATFTLTRSSGETVDIVFKDVPGVERSKVHSVPVLYLEPKTMVTSVSLVYDSSRIVKGTDKQFGVTVKPEDATDQTVTWTSSDEKVATVDETGLVSAVAVGESIITATANDGSGAYGAVMVTVYVPVRSITPTVKSVELTVGGDAYTVQYTVQYSVGPDDATNKSVSWSSNDEKVATVDNGVITPVAAGNCTITISATDDSGVTATIAVTVSTGPYNGHKYVDLGLPSGLKWADCNVGAKNPHDDGDFFGWAETEPYCTIAADGSLTWAEGKEAGYRWSSYKWVKRSFEYWEYNPEDPSRCISRYTIPDTQYYTIWYQIIMGENETKYIFNGDNVSSLSAPEYDYEDDAARQKWGDDWRIPSPEDFQELIDITNNAWTGNYNETGKAGYVFTSKIDATKSIFLPASGMRANDIIINAKVAGYYWSSSLSDDDTQYAQFLNFSSDYASMNDGDRCYGRTIRPVAN